MNRLSNITTATEIFKRSRRKLLTTTMLTAAGLMSLAPHAKAMDDFTTPEGEQVVGGSASFDRPELGTLNIDQHTDRVVINWNHFNIGSKGKTEFFQPGRGSLAVNRVTGGNADPTRILGTLKANGQVMVIDRNGVFFGENSVVDVGGIIASTGDLSDADVMDGDGQFKFENFGDGKIELNGTVSVAEAGLAAFVSPFVSNNGIINAKLGKVAFAGGDKVTLDLYGDDLIEIAVNDKAANALLKNSGTINAEGGEVLMTAQAAKDAVDDVINMSGVVNVSSVEVQGGKIILKGGEQGAVNVSGTLDASGTTGGTVDVTGQNVFVAETAVTNVSGGAGADGVGDAGRATFIAQDHTDFRGLILGRGGENGGDGAFAEVSGRGALGYSGVADLFAAEGNLGTLLLDPTFAIIHSGLVNNPLGFSYILASWALANSMENANVVVQADNFIDVGTQNSAYNTGNALVDLALNTLVGTGNIDLSTFDYNTLEQTGSFKIGKVVIPVFGLVNHHGTTNGSITFQSDVVNVNKDVKMGNGGVTVDAATLNLDGKFYDVDGTTKLGDARLIGTGKLATINVESPKAYINQGINFADDATNPTTVNVGDGTYAESVELNEANVNLHSVNLHKATITPNSPGVHVTANDTTVDGFEIVGGNIGVHVHGADRVKVTNNLIHGQRDATATGKQTGNPGTGDGILVTRTAGSIVDDLLIKGNVVYDTDDEDVQVETGNNITIVDNVFDNRETGVGGVANGQTAIYASLLTGVNTIARNLIYSGWDAGIHISNSSGLTIGGATDAEANTIIGRGPGSTDYGIRIQNSDGTTKTTWVKVLNNSIDDTGSDGVFVDSSDYTLVESNDISDAGRDGVRVIDSKGSTIKGNTITGSVHDGVFVDPSPATIVDGNTITGGVNGVEITNSDDSQVTNNTISGQTANGVVVNSGSDNVKVYKNKVTEAVETATGIFIDGGIKHVVDNNETIGGTVGIHVKAADDVKVTNNYVHGQRNKLALNTNTALPGTGDGILVTAKSGDLANNLLIQYNRVEDTDDESLHVQGASNITIVDNTFDNRETGPVDGVANGDNALYAALLKGVNLIARNTIYSGWETGIFLDQVKGTTVGGATDAEANHVYGRGATPGNFDVGIFVNNSGGAGAPEVKVLNNFVQDTGRDGIGIKNSAWTLADDNTINNAQRNGIRIIDSAHATASNNTVTNIQKDGIFVDPSDYAVVTGNTLDYVIGHSVNIVNSDHVTVTNNKIGQTSGGYINWPNGTGDGVHVGGGSDDAFVDGNIISTDGRGVALIGGDSHEVSNNKINTVSWVNSADEGIYADSTTNASIHDNNVTTADNAGIRVSGGSNVSVDKNQIHGATEQGIDILSVATANVTNNSVENTFSHGIHAFNTSGLTISGNWVGYSDTVGTVGGAGNIGADGINVIESDGAQIANNHVINTVGNGIFVDPSDNVTVSGNTVNNAGLAGIRITEGDSNKILSNTVNNSGTVNIWGDIGTNLTISGNTSNGSFYGIYADNLGGLKNYISLNTVDGASVNGITVTGSSNVLIGGDDGIIPGHQGDSGNFVTNSGENGIELGYGGTNNLISNNTVSGFGHDGIYVHDTDNASVTINEVYNGGFGYFGGNGIDLQNVTTAAYVYDNVVHDISDALTIYTDASATNNGIFAKGIAALQVLGNYIGWIDSGVTAGAASNINGDGIDVEDSPSAQINFNNVINVAGNGIFLDPSDDAIIDSNVIDYAFGHSIDVENSDRVKVTNNSIGAGSGGYINPGFGTGDGIHVAGGSDDAFVDNNTIATDGRGVSLLGGDGHEVSNNTITTVSWVNSADEGIYAENTSNANIHDNHVTTADNAGIRVSGGSNATVNHNDIHAATEQGIDIQSVLTAFVTNNTVDNTGSHGINAYNTTGLTISGNLVGTTGGANNINGDGIHVVDSAGAQITGNTTNNVTGNGLFVDPSPNTLIQENSFLNSGANGISLVDSINSNIVENTVTNSALDGIHVVNSAGTEINENVIDTTGGNGIYVLNSDGVDIGGLDSDYDDDDYASGNTINYATLNGIFVDNSDDVDVKNNVIGNLDGGHFGSGSGDGILVANGSDRAFVDNNTVTTDGRGVSLLGGDGHEVSNNTITTISWVNSADEGIYADSTTNANIHDNHVTTADNAGIRVSGGSNATVNHNDIHAATEQGIDIESVAGADVTNNFIENVFLDGIFAYNTTDLFVTGNIIQNTGDDGIDVEYSDGASITGNYVGYSDAGVTAGGANNIGGDGIVLIESDGADISSNLITNTVGNGIFVDPSDNLHVANNNIQNAGNDGVHVEGGDQIRINANTINNSAHDGIFVTGASNLTISDDEGFDGFADGEYDGNQISNSGHDGIEVVNTDTALIEESYITGSYYDGIFVDPSSNVTIDGNSVNGSGYDGIHADQVTGLTISSNYVSGANNEDIEVTGSSNVQVLTNTIDSYYGYNNDDGIEVGTSDGVLISGNFVSSVSDDGIDVYSNTDTTVSNNVVHNAGANGIVASYISSSDYYGHALNVTGNTVYNTGSDGIHVSNSDYAAITGNYVGYTDAGFTAGDPNNIGGDGVQLVDTNGATIASNLITNVSGNGIFVDPSPNTLIQENTISNSGQNGINVDTGGDNVNIVENTVTNSAWDGIHVTGSNNVEINENTVTESGYYGIYVYDTNYVDIGGLDSDYDDDYYASGNNVSDSGIDGIHVEDFGFANVVNNTVDESGDDGIETVYGDGVHIANNRVTDSGLGYGYYYGVGDYYGADGIHVRNVGNYGFYGDFAVDIEDNYVDVTGDDGIEVLDSGRTLIAGNTVSHAGSSDYYYYGYGDGTGADGIHVAGVSNYGYYGYYEFAGGIFGGDFYGYAVNIIDNSVDRTGDDGIEVTDSSSTLIQANSVTHAGVVDGYYGTYYGGGGDYYGADGIHIRNVYGDEGYGSPGFGYYDYFQSYSVVVDGNTVDTSADDGIEVVDSGRTLVSYNNVSNSGFGDGYYYYGDNQDGWGHDGIHVRNVYADNGYYGYYDVGGYYDGYYGSGYDVEVIGNMVDVSQDDGIEVTYTDSGYEEYPEEGGYYGEGYLTTPVSVGVFQNTVSNSGDDGIDVTNANYVWVDSNNVSNSGGDGITVNRDGSDDYYGGYYGDYYGFAEVFVDIVYDPYFPNNVVITNNTVDNSGDDGIEVQGYGQIEIGNNIVTNSGDDGVIVHDLLFGSAIEEPIFEKIVLFDPYYLEANVNIHDNQVGQSGGDGIQVDAFNDFFDAPAGSNVYVTNNFVQNSGANGLYISGPSHGYVYVAGNTFLNNPVGANFESGLVDLTGPGNSFLGGNVGLFFNPWYGQYWNLSLVDDDALGYETFPSVITPTNFGGTIGEQFFSGQSLYFVQLGNQAFWDPFAGADGEAIWLNGLNSTYDTPFGLVHPADTGGALSPDVFAFLEDRFFHFPDTGNTGIFFFGFVQPEQGVDIDQRKLFNTFDPFNGNVSGLNVTVLGLPNVPGAGGVPNLTPGALNAIQTFAGGQEDGTLSPEELNAIETAAGAAEGTTENGQQAAGSGQQPGSCWGDVMNAAYNGKVVNYSYATGAEETVAGAASCSTPAL